jgi:hypothetical protein
MAALGSNRDARAIRAGNQRRRGQRQAPNARGGRGGGEEPHARRVDRTLTADRSLLGARAEVVLVGGRVVGAP